MKCPDCDGSGEEREAGDTLLFLRRERLQVRRMRRGLRGGRARRVRFLPARAGHGGRRLTPKGETMSERPKPTTACEQFAELAYEAVDAWDGQDNGDLIRLLGEYMGLSMYELKCLVEKLMAEDCEEYHREHGLAPEPAPTSDTSPEAGTEGQEDSDKGRTR